jgi:putative transferase (TIGR04331 family)
MTIRTLVTTSDEKTWPKDKAITFLGTWCLNYNRNFIWNNLNYQIEPYHWDNNKKFSDDYKYLSSIYKRALNQCAKELNKIHDVDYSYKYWEIVIGPWLKSFTGILYDRWYMISQTLKKTDKFETIVINRNLYPPQNFSDFLDKSTTDDLWNHLIYYEAIKLHRNLKVIKVDLPRSAYKSKSSRINITKRFLKKIRGIFSIFSTKNNFFLISSYFDVFSLIKLELFLRQIPSFPISPNIPCFKVSNEFRKNININLSQDILSFENFLSKLIPKQMPKCYIEGYKHIAKQIKIINWPSNPKTIFTSNSHIADDFFKFWAALKVVNGTQLICGQHGGQYGIGKFSMWEDHERSISDKYFSWGWKGKNIIDMSASKLVGAKPRNNHICYSNKELLLVSTSVPRYSYTLGSIPIAGQILKEIESQMNFVKSLDHDIQSKLTVKLQKFDYKQFQKQRWTDELPGISISSNKSQLNKIIEDCRLLVSTYNATVFLESLSRNIPTILLWNPDFWQLRESVKSDFEILEKSEIMHYNAKSASTLINSIWADVEGWWLDEDRQQVIKKFCHKYARVNNKWLSEWKRHLSQ